MGKVQHRRRHETGERARLMNEWERPLKWCGAFAMLPHWPQSNIPIFVGWIFRGNIRGEFTLSITLCVILPRQTLRL